MKQGDLEDITENIKNLNVNMESHYIIEVKESSYKLCVELSL